MEINKSGHHFEWIWTFQVKVRYSIDGGSSGELVGLSARFGSLLPTKEEQALTAPLTLADPFNSCSNYSSQVISSFYYISIILTVLLNLHN
jgi:hypothetical protein